MINQIGNIVFAVFNFVIILFCLGCLLIGSLAIYDLIWYKKWGYPWWSIVVLFGMILVALLIRILARKIHHIDG